jgi:glycerol-3-phosphate dehydrogenase
MELGAADGSLLEPIAAGTPVLAIELRFAIDHELALTVDDLLERRTRLSLVEDDCTSARERAEELLIHAGRRRPAAVTPGLSSTQG